MGGKWNGARRATTLAVGLLALGWVGCGDDGAPGAGCLEDADCAGGQGE
jgi:hypothetical protein